MTVTKKKSEEDINGISAKSGGCSQDVTPRGKKAKIKVTRDREGAQLLMRGWGDGKQQLFKKWNTKLRGQVTSQK